jgi:hypothetical protein
MSMTEAGPRGSKVVFIKVPKVPVDRHLKAQLLATRLFPPSKPAYRFTKAVLLSAAHGAESITIISAFYDLQWCERLIRDCGIKHVRLVVNGLGGRRLKGQREELRELKRSAEKTRVVLDVRLAFAPGIFHSKLIVIEHPRRAVAFIGSANATSAAMERNEEIMLRVSGDLVDLIEYANRICAKHSVDAAEETPEALPETLVTFFRTGSLYFKSATSLQLTLNPFREIERELPEKVKTQLGSVSLPHSEGQTGIGAFSLIRALKLGKDQRSASAKIKPFVVETSLGYWVPDELAGELRDVLDVSTRAKRRAWIARKKAILATSTERARKLYAQYVEAVRTLLGKYGVELELEEGARDPFALERFDSFYRSITARLQNKHFFDRLIDPFSPTGVPEMWDDPLARRDFEESFFEYLAYAATLSYRPRVPQTILSTLEGPIETADEIRTALEMRLGDGWDPSLWLR